MPGTPSRVSSQVTIEKWTDVKQLVKNSDEFAFKALILKPGQAESDNVENLAPIHKIPLHLVQPVSASTLQITTFKSHRGNSCLKTMPLLVAGPDYCHQDLLGIEVIKVRTYVGYVHNQIQHAFGKIKWRECWPSFNPRWCLISNFVWKKVFFGSKTNLRNRLSSRFPAQGGMVVPHANKRITAPLNLN